MPLADGYAIFSLCTRVEAGVPPAGGSKSFCFGVCEKLGEKGIGLGLSETVDDRKMLLVPAKLRLRLLAGASSRAVRVLRTEPGVARRGVVA
jgi:hypothetical protein